MLCKIVVLRMSITLVFVVILGIWITIKIANVRGFMSGLYMVLFVKHTFCLFICSFLELVCFISGQFLFVSLYVYIVFSVQDTFCFFICSIPEFLVCYLTVSVLLSSNISIRISTLTIHKS